MERGCITSEDTALPFACDTPCHEAGDTEIVDSFNLTRSSRSNFENQIDSSSPHPIKSNLRLGESGGGYGADSAGSTENRIADSIGDRQVASASSTPGQTNSEFPPALPAVLCQPPTRSKPASLNLEKSGDGKTEGVAGGQPRISTGQQDGADLEADLSVFSSQEKEQRTKQTYRFGGGGRGGFLTLDKSSLQCNLFVNRCVTVLIIICRVSSQYRTRFFI